MTKVILGRTMSLDVISSSDILPHSSTSQETLKGD